MHSERDGEPLAPWQGAERSLPLSSLPPKPSTPVGSWAAQYHPSSNLPHWQQLQRSQKATHFSLSPTVNRDCCDGRQNAHNYSIWCKRHVLSICNREPRRQNPSMVHKARRNREFCLPPHREPQDRAMPQREFQKSTAQRVKPVLGMRDELKSHASGRQESPKRLQTTPLTKLSRHMRKQLFFPPPCSPSPSLTLVDHPGLEKANQESWTQIGRDPPVPCSFQQW